MDRLNNDLPDGSTYKLYRSLTKFIIVIKIGFRMIRKELGKSDLEQPVFRAIASAQSAGANDQAIMEFLAALIDLRIPAGENVARSVEVVSEAGRLWLAEYMLSLAWSTRVKAAGVVDKFGKHKDCVFGHTSFLVCTA